MMNPLRKKLNDCRIILGSQSPRRKQLLGEFDIPFEIIVKDVEESFPEHLRNEEIALYIAQKKAKAFTAEIADAKTIVITADSIVCLDDHVLGKPVDLADAARTLKLLSGRMHFVFTGVCLISKEKSVSFFSKTDVTFRKLKEEEINYYVEAQKPLDKAGAYGIQEWIGAVGVEQMSGSYSNVMGLPLKELYEQLLAF
jgi:septum formation protein